MSRRVVVGLDLGKGEEAGYLFKLAKRQPTAEARQGGRQGVKSVMELGGGRRREGPPLALVSSVLTKETEQKASQLVLARAKALFLRSHHGNQGSMQASFVDTLNHVPLILNTYSALLSF